MRRLFRRLLLPGSAVVVTVCLLAYSTIGSPKQWFSTPLVAHPVLICPDVIDFGPQSVGEIVTKEFEIANGGSDILQIDDIRQSCTCSGFEVMDKDGSWLSATTIWIRAGEPAKARVRLIVRGQAATATKAVVRFQTNVPDLPESQLQIVVPYIKAGLLGFPAEVHLGFINAGAVATRDIDVYDDSPTPGSGLTLGAVSDPRVQVEVVPAAAVPQDAGRVLYGSYLGRVRVVVTGTPGRIRENVVIQAGGRAGAVLNVPLSAEIGLPVVVLPARLVWPAPTAPRLARLVFRSQGATIRGVVPVRLPVGVTVMTPSVTAESAAKVIELQFASAAPPPSDRPLIAAFRATLTDGRTVDMDVNFDPN